ncbi:hypothetical protein BS47DRAFT_1411366 [Hydnum rufescens UP504]|uniref:Uncharacterized protein n=1 Tax=Hydnum rufescens UP504 TaxID=1448309 RepID=A0A9P6DSS4_9AGAM|nr:hypothetical protein BS47DRAFT_1411366 [Hydnum rufescens UP504]
MSQYDSPAPLPLATSGMPKSIPTPHLEAALMSGNSSSPESHHNHLLMRGPRPVPDKLNMFMNGGATRDLRLGAESLDLLSSGSGLLLSKKHSTSTTPLPTAISPLPNAVMKGLNLRLETVENSLTCLRECMDIESAEKSVLVHTIATLKMKLDDERTNRKILESKMDDLASQIHEMHLSRGLVSYSINQKPVLKATKGNMNKDFNAITSVAWFKLMGVRGNNDLPTPLGGDDFWDGEGKERLLCPDWSRTWAKANDIWLTSIIPFIQNRGQHLWG